MLSEKAFKHKHSPKFPFLFSSRAMVQQQEMQLYKLLHKARKTAFGRYYHFSEMTAAAAPSALFRAIVPITDYDTFYQKWLRFSLMDEPDITWPGVVPYYALSSGTSGAASKYIPVTQDMLNSMTKSVMRSFFDLIHFKIPPGQVLKSILMIGSGTSLQRDGQHYTGDLSGIMGLNRPVWLEPYYRPGRQITDLKDWNSRIDAIVQNAERWDIGLVVGNPMWVQIVFEKIIAHYGLNHIHELWPNFRFYAHSGVFFEPYRTSFEKLLGKTVLDGDTYLASEGYFGYQPKPGSPLKLLINNGIYYEFVPFNDRNFDEDGNLREHPEVVGLDQVQNNVSYALVISTNAGLWRYLLGDTIMFNDVEQLTFRITGRTKLFLSVCGEHLSVDNINEAVRRADLALHAGVREFAVAGFREGTGWAHHWWVSLENQAVSPEVFIQLVDQHLKILNDDYATEREFALHHVRATLLPCDTFYNWLSNQGKMNGQTKIPRVMKGKTLDHWLAHVATVNTPVVEIK